MALTPSNMIELDILAPDFNLPDTVSGRKLSFSDLKGEHGTLVMFICNHCPYVIHVEKEISALGVKYQKLGIGVVAISSNDIENHPDDSPDKMREFAERLGFTFPYLYDEDQLVASAYDAACTPDFYLFDSDDKLVYRGRLDDSRPGNDIPLTGKDLRSAIDNLLAGQPRIEPQYPSMGCNIKWKA